MVSTKSKGMNWKIAQLFFILFQSLFERSLSAFILPIWQQKDWSNLVNMFAFFHGLHSQIETWANVRSSSAWQAVDMLVEGN